METLMLRAKPAGPIGSDRNLYPTYRIGLHAASHIKICDFFFRCHVPAQPCIPLDCSFVDLPLEIASGAYFQERGIFLSLKVFFNLYSLLHTEFS